MTTTNLLHPLKLEGKAAPIEEREGLPLLLYDLVNGHAKSNCQCTYSAPCHNNTGVFRVNKVVLHCYYLLSKIKLYRYTEVIYI